MTTVTVCQESTCLIVAVKTSGKRQFLRTLNNKRQPSVSLGYRWRSCLAGSWWSPWSKRNDPQLQNQPSGSWGVVLHVLLFLSQSNKILPVKGDSCATRESISDKTLSSHMTLIQQNTRTYGVVWCNSQAPHELCAHRAMPTTPIKYYGKYLISFSIALQPE